MGTNFYEKIIIRNHKNELGNDLKQIIRSKKQLEMTNNSKDH